METLQILSKRLLTLVRKKTKKITMKNFIYLFLVISVFGCRDIEKKESLYFLYYGDLKPSIRPMVLKNSPNSYVDPLMEVGSPLEYNLNKVEFENLVDIIKTKHQFKNKEKETGIVVIYYKNKKPTEKYIFTCKKEVDDLIFKINEIVIDSMLNKKIFDWINVTQGLHDNFN